MIDKILELTKEITNEGNVEEVLAEALKELRERHSKKGCFPTSFPH